MILMWSCNPALKSTRYMLEHRPLLSQICSETYPPVSIDTTYLSTIDSAGFEESIVSLVGLVDSLLNNKDTVMIEGINILVSPNIDSLRAVLLKQIKIPKPIVRTEIRTITKIDNAALTDCSNKLGQEHEKYIKAETERGVYKLQAKSRLWLMVLAFFLLGVSGYFNIKNIFK